MVKENIEGERPTQVDGIGRIVGLLRGMRGNKRGTRGKKTYASGWDWQDSSFLYNSKCKE